MIAAAGLCDCTRSWRMRAGRARARVCSARRDCAGSPGSSSPSTPRLQPDIFLSVISALEVQLDSDAELRRFARGDERCQALQSIYGIGPILACHLLAEIGDINRFPLPRKLAGYSGLCPARLPIR
jgi:Transposase IS116/IS110/IS902 family